ncbi:hypothetical protein GCM10023210_03370 [Chryseobacterium ginsengisoli]|uniref:Deoxyribose-phosphate aldolase n=1 Tax=Chryseobacterium ginsengisoli TaxID=363853 RepID=A0ABP9LX21_9FLAO
MGINKIIFLNILLFLIVGCKKEVNAQDISKLDTTKTEKYTTSKNNDDYLKKLHEKSFVVSCGGGCAMTYKAIGIQKKESKFIVKFTVEMYINEVLSDTYDETYLFEYDRFGKIDKILQDGKKQNILETLPTGAQKSFVEFSENLNGSLVSNDQNVLDNNKFIIANNPKKIILPFSFQQYFKDDFSEIKYPTYEPTVYLIDFLKKKNYDAESYKSFVIRSDVKFLYLIISIQRGDSEYFVLVTIKNSNIIDYKEIGAIGESEPITFKVLPNYNIERYNNNETNDVAFEKLKISETGEILTFK